MTANMAADPWRKNRGEKRPDSSLKFPLSQQLLRRVYQSRYWCRDLGVTHLAAVTASRAVEIVKPNTHGSVSKHEHVKMSMSCDLLLTNHTT